MTRTADIHERLLAAGSLAEVLAAAFDAFEHIRTHARASELHDPAMFAAFMATANAAVDGREALTAAPSLPPIATSPPTGTTATASTSSAETAAHLSAIGSLLAERLTLVASQTVSPGDQSACAQAAEAARRIHGFMAGDGDGCLW